MPDPDTPPLIDGFSSIQAIRRSGRPPGEGRFRKPGDPPPEPPPKPAGTPVPERPAGRIGHTAIPRRTEVVCYTCGFEHFITGHIHNPFCPKCRTKLETGDVRVAEAAEAPIKTIGTVEVTATGVLRGATVTAGHLVVAGAVEGGDVRVAGRLEIAPGGRCDVAAVRFRDLVVQAGADCVLAAPLACRHITVGGRLAGTLQPSGLVRILPGGLVEGAIDGPRLAVDEGGGLRAELRIDPSVRRPDPPPPTRPDTPEPPPPGATTPARPAPRRASPGKKTRR